MGETIDTNLTGNDKRNTLEENKDHDVMKMMEKVIMMVAAVVVKNGHMQDYFSLLKNMDSRSGIHPVDHPPDIINIHSTNAWSISRFSHVDKTKEREKKCSSIK